MWLYEWMRWEQRLMVLCALAFTGAVIYAQFDEDFGDWLAWVHRELQYPNAVTIYCVSGGPCESMGWTLSKASDKSPNALVIDWDKGRLTAQDLADMPGLRARGWVVTYAAPDRGVLQMQTPPKVGDEGFVQVTHNNGALSAVIVRPEKPLALTLQGRTVSIPASRREIAGALGAPVKMVRVNAINGPLPD